MGVGPDREGGSPMEYEASGFGVSSLLSWVLLLVLAGRGDNSRAPGLPPPALFVEIAWVLSLRRLPST